MLDDQRKLWDMREAKMLAEIKELEIETKKIDDDQLEGKSIFVKLKRK